MFQGYEDMIVASVNIHLHELNSFSDFIHMINQAYLHNQIAKYQLLPQAHGKKRKGDKKNQRPRYTRILN